MTPDVRKGSFSCCFGIDTKSMSRKQRKALREMFHPLTRPAHITPSRKVKWRLVKKWFNRYEKPRLIGSRMMAQAPDGYRLPIEIADVRISKAGGHRRNISFTAKPIGPIMKEDCAKCESCLFYHPDCDDAGTCKVSDNIVEATQDACNDYADKDGNDL